MRLRKINIWLVAALLSLLVNIYLAFQNRDSTLKYIESTSNHVYEKYLTDLQKERFEITFNSNYKILNNLSLINIKSEEVSLCEVITAPTLVLKISANSCPPCVKDNLKTLKQLGEVIGFDKIMIITDYENSRMLNLLKSENSIFSPCYATSENLGIDLPIDSLKVTPFFFIISEDLSIQSSFIADDKLYTYGAYMERIKSIFLHDYVEK